MAAVVEAVTSTAEVVLAVGREEVADTVDAAMDTMDLVTHLAVVMEAVDTVVGAGEAQDTGAVPPTLTRAVVEVEAAMAAEVEVVEADMMATTEGSVVATLGVVVVEGTTMILATTPTSPPIMAP